MYGTRFLFSSPSLSSAVDLPQRPLSQFSRDVHRAASNAGAPEGQYHCLFRALPTRQPPLSKLNRVLRELEASLIGP